MFSDWLLFSGVYTCVAWNMEGADTKSVSVSVDSVGWWWSEGSRPDSEPSREQPWRGNWSAAASLVVLAKVSASRLCSLFVSSQL